MDLSFRSINLQVGESDGDVFRYGETFTPDTPELADCGKLFVSMEIDDSVLEAEQLAEIILGTLHQHLYQDPSKDPYESFEETLQVINEKLGDFANHKGDIWVGHVHAVLGFLSQNVLHITQTGEAQVYLLRGQKLNNLSEGLTPEPDDLKADTTFLSISSGSLKQNDVLVFASRDLLSSISEEALINGLITADITNEDSVRKNIQTLDSLQMVLAEMQELLQEEEALLEETVNNLSEEEAWDSPSLEASTDKTSFSPVSEPNFWNKLKMVTESLIVNPLKNRKLSEEYHLKDKLDKLAKSHDQGRKSKAGNTYEIFKENTAKSLNKLFSPQKRMLSARSLSQNSSRIIAAVAVLLILGTVTIWYWSFSSSRAERKHYDEVIAQISEERSMAETRAIYDMDGAKRLLIQVQNKINELKNSNLSEYQSKGNDEQLKLQTLMDKVDNVHRLDKPTVAFDLSQKRPGVEPRGFVPTNNALYAYDKNALYRLLLDEVNLRTITLSGAESFDIQASTFFTQDDSILLFTKDKQMIKYKNDNFTLLPPPAEGFKDAIALSDYARRKLVYFLDPLTNEIWRYAPETDNFGQPGKKNWGQDLSKAVDFGVDGALYVLTNEGKILKSYNDQASPFEITGLIQPLKNPSKVFVDQDETSGNVYVLDQENKRVVVLGKAGEYKSQYVFENIGNLLDVYANGAENSLYVLSADGKVYKTELTAKTN